MTGRRLTLTTIGLSIRDEMRVKSMLQLVEGKTAATWTYVDEAGADLAICEPESTLAQAVSRQATQRGRPRCVSLVRQGAQPMEDTPAVFAPLRVSDFISMLDATLAAQGVDTSLNTQQLMAAAHAEAATQNEGFLLAHALRDIAAKNSQHTFRLVRGNVSIYVLPAQASVFASEDLSPELLTELAQVSTGFEVTELGNDAMPASESGFRRHSLQYVLWNCGLLGTTTDLLPWLPRMARFRLQRWPDFGRLGHKTWQVRLTSILINNAYTPQQMTSLVQQPIANIRGFLNGCELCGLLTHEALADDTSEADEPETAAAVTPAESKAGSRWSGLLRSIRNALHIGD
ncbi:hypothetical protein [Steroidobacter sp.]|uniref:hypothetical protein n=1 Tax=Steroidobacter sp. TaxID=1978227 RepID=UPI0025E2E465|nr:hypothetical protein [Steroidobacter sp.]